MSKPFALSWARRFLVWAGCACLMVAVLHHSLVAAVAPAVSTNRSFADLRESAAKGDALAQRLVANAYLSGEGVKKDLVEGVRWLRLAADQRDPVAQYVLGTLYDQGEGVPADLREAVKWYELAAAQGLPDAQYNLAICYSKGEGVAKKDLKIACEWFRRAALQGDAQSQSRLGLAYISGSGVERDRAEAANWLRKAAYQDVATAQFYLGRLCQEGQGVPQEFDVAAKWYRKAAIQGLAEAQFYLGTMLLEGTGIDRNLSEGREWIEKAAAQGHQAAMQYLAQSRTNASATTATSEKPAVLAPPPGGRAFTPNATANPVVPSLPAPRETAGFNTPAATKPDLSNLPFTQPTAAPSNLSTPAAARDPLPGLPTLPAVGGEPEKHPASAPPTTAKAADVGLPPFSETNATKPAPPTPPTRSMFDLPPTTKEADPASLFTEPPRTREPGEPPTRSVNPAPVSAANGDGGDLKWIAIISAIISAAILFLGIFMLYAFQTRLRSLETELKKAQFELSKANVNLSAMMHQVEQLSLSAPAATPKTSLPEWNPEPAKAHASSFKMHRSK